jgi:hypothetical protein
MQMEESDLDPVKPCPSVVQSLVTPSVVVDDLPSSKSAVPEGRSSSGEDISIEMITLNTTHS